MKNKLLIPLIIVSVCGLTISGSLSGLFIAKQVNYNQLSTDYETLIDEYSNVDDNYQAILNEFGNLTLDYQSLLVSFEELVDQYDLLVGENADLQDALDQLTNMYNTLQDALTNLQSDYDALTQDYNDLVSDYNDLSQAYDALLIDFNTLTQTYNTLLNDYAILTQTFDDLLDSYNDLLAENNILINELNAMVDSIKSLPLLDKMTYFYHLCRMDFDPWYNSSLVFARDLILHGSLQYNEFTEIDDLLDQYNFWEYEGYIYDYNSSMNDYCVAMDNCFGDWIQGLFGSFTVDEVFNWITSNIDYRYDSETAFGRNYPIDLYLSALETLKYRCGDCDDFAILGGSFFEVRGWDVKFVTIHDDTYYPGELHHAFLWVNVGEATWLANSITNPAWTFNDGLSYDWVLVDLTPGWQSTIWHEPSWLTWYDNNGVQWSQWGQFVNSIDCDPPT